MTLKLSVNHLHKCLRTLSITPIPALSTAIVSLHNSHTVFAMWITMLEVCGTAEQTCKCQRHTQPRSNEMRATGPGAAVDSDVLGKQDSGRSAIWATDPVD